MTIDNAKTFSQVWHKIFETIKTISDPGNKSKWVYSSFPDITIDNEANYPLIVVHPIDITYVPHTFVDIKLGTVSVTIEVFSSSASQLDTISNDILDKMESSDEAFTMSGIFAMKLASTSYDFVDRSPLKIHNKVINYEFQHGWF